MNSNYNTREEILACNEPLSFDGVYLNVYQNRDVLEGKDVTLFVMGDYVGRDNSFDKGMPLEKFCDWNQIDVLVDMGCKLGWHTWSHRDLTKLDHYEDIIDELEPPFETDLFAYPYGRFDKTVLEAVKQVGFTKAYSVFQGDGSELQLKRSYL